MDYTQHLDDSLHEGQGSGIKSLILANLLSISSWHHTCAARCLGLVWAPHACVESAQPLPEHALQLSLLHMPSQYVYQLAEHSRELYIVTNA